LQAGFSAAELAPACREAIKMNHPDKVAALDVEFKKLAEQRTRLINQAYSTLKAGSA
jgi:curved DNA-binding protein CbpA